MPQRPRVYLAGPDVFRSNPIERGAELKRLVADFGLDGVFPLDAEMSASSERGPALGLEIHERNEALIRSCDGILANLSPFRGPSADVGTVFEVGFARALGLTIVGYSDNAESFEDRTVMWVRDRGDDVRVRSDGSREDGDGHQIESFDLHDNLMIDGAIRASGGVVIAGGEEPARRAAAALAERLAARVSVTQLAPTSHGAPKPDTRR